jgi:hypothetical protein
VSLAELLSKFSRTLRSADRLNRYEFERRYFPGLWLAVEELLAGNMRCVLAVLQEGVQSPEHGAFAQKLDSY